MCRYCVDIENFEKIVIPYLEESVNSEKIIIIDEIGPMELLSDKFTEVVNNIIQGTNNVLGAIFLKEHERVDKIKAIEGLNIINVTLENRDAVCEQICQSINSIEM